MSNSRISDRELWACAQQYIHQHADNAAIMAAMRADELLEQGDVEGAKTFIAIVRRIKKLMSPPVGALH